METIVTFLRRRLREAGSGMWESIAAETGLKHSLLRKLAYGDRENPQVQSIQPLLDYFAAVDRGERVLPPAREAA